MARSGLAGWILVLAGGCGWAIGSAAAATLPEATYGDLRWRPIGPMRGGWATCAAGLPGDPTTFYFGAAGGGLWKTSDAGVTWQSVFGGKGSASIGALAIAPSDSRVIWVGTGHIQQRWDIEGGDGVYRSRDGGETWEPLGLPDSEHIGRIWVDPRDANVALVAALGHVFGSNQERGIFRTADGGRSWQKVLYKNANTGGADLAGDPAVPDTVFASLWQVRRYPWLDYWMPPVGTGSGIYKSTDGGKTWAVVGGKGLPSGTMGRIVLAVAPGMGARRVWAAIQAGAGGVYRSDDGGDSWSRLDAGPGLASAYTSGLTADPKNPEVVWAMGRSIHRSTDGGKTFAIVKGAPGGDDYHFLWIDPRDARHMITASDQGAVITLNAGKSWSSWYNQPTGQFYRLAADDRFPYWVYSGQQDSGTAGVASRSDYGQLTFRDWHPVGGDERDGDVPDPADPEIVYGAGLGGRLSKWHGVTGQVQNVSPWPISTYAQRPTTVRYRYSWITPLAISPRPPHTIYQGAQLLFRSNDGGQTWQTISPDLTGAHREGKNCDGDVGLADATACGFGVIFAIAPSPVADGVVWVGTDNGRVQRTAEGGAHWQDVTPKDMADWTKINIVDASTFDAETAYVAADRHRLDDRHPLAWRTHDAGAHWTEIGHGLPAGEWVGSIRQDRVRKGLLFAGTSAGVYVSIDDGDRWQSLRLNLPTVAINDLLVHGDDLIAATEGRGIWILDDLAPLRGAEPARLAAREPYLVPPATAMRWIPNENRDTPLPPEEPRLPNPPAGAVFDYILSAAPAAPAAPITLEVLGADGKVLRSFRSDETPRRPPGEVYFADVWLGAPVPLPAHAGHNRFVWNLRGPRPHALDYELSIAAIPGAEVHAVPEGPFVLPGSYEVRLTVGGKTLSQHFAVVADPRSTAKSADLEAQLAFEHEVIAALDHAASVAEAIRNADRHLAAAAADPHAAALKSQVEQAAKELRALRQPRLEDPIAIAGSLTALEADLESVDAAPTTPQREVLADSRARLEQAARAWEEWRNTHYQGLEAKLRAAGVKETGDEH
jgi:photosystem II stability/assembly factor-like uncharacterized protein